MCVFTIRKVMEGGGGGGGSEVQKKHSCKGKFSEKNYARQVNLNNLHALV